MWAVARTNAASKGGRRVRILGVSQKMGQTFVVVRPLRGRIVRSFSAHFMGLLVVFDLLHYCLQKAPL